MKRISQLFTFILLVGVAPAQAGLRPDPGADHCEEAALEALLKQHADFKAWDLVKKLHWDSTGKDAFAAAFPSEVRVSVPEADPIEHFTVAYSLGVASSLRVGVQRSGKICLLIKIADTNKKVSIEAAAEKLIELADKVVNGNITATFAIQPLEEQAQKIFMVFDATDTDLSPGVEDATAKGRDIFLQSALAYLAEFSDELAQTLAPTAKVKKEAGKPSVLAAPKTIKPLSTSKTITAIHYLGDGLLEHVALNTSPDKNPFMSAPSAAYAWGAASAGAYGETAAQMLKTFGISGEADDAWALVQGLGALMNDLFPTGDKSVVGANAVFSNSRFPLHPDYQNLLETHLRAVAESLPFGNPAAAERINSWVKEQTLQLIPKLIDKTESLDIAYLISVVALAVKWESQFDKALTATAPFAAADGSTVQVPMMQKDAAFNYGVSRIPGSRTPVQGVSLPTTNPDIVVDFWGLDGRNPSPASLVALAKPSTIADLALEFEANKKGLFELPRLKLEFDTDLIAALRAMGAQLPFEDADFRRMATGDIYISQALQKTALELEEEGVKAAAATVVVAKTRSISRPVEKFHLRLDQPFVIAIRNTRTGVVTFSGIINKP